MQQRKSRFSSYTPNFVGAEPAAAVVPVADTPPAPPAPPEALEPSPFPSPRKTPTGKGGQSARLPSKRMRELSDYVTPFSARLRPEQAQSFDALVAETGKSRVRLLEEALTMLFKHYGTRSN